MEKTTIEAGITKPQSHRDRIIGSLLSLPSALWITIFIVVPIFIMIAHSLIGTQRFKLGGKLTLDNYIFLFESATFATLFVKTLLVAFVTTVVCAVLAYPTAYKLAFRAGRKTQILLSLLLLPYLIGYIPRILSIRMILGIEGLINRILLGIGLVHEPLEFLLFSNFATVIGLIYVQLPVTIILLFISFEQISPAFLEASYDLGASRFYTFRRVLVPLSRSGLIASSLLVFLPAVGAYVEPALMGGADGQLIGNIIAQRFIVFMDISRGSALALATVLIILFLVALASRFLRWRGLHGPA